MAWEPNSRKGLQAEVPDNAPLQRRARQILKMNDRGGYTIPADGLYPFQWNWDSGITALGLATFDESRAWRELEYLFMGQWEHGLLPHIVFHVEDETYFPGPEQWGVNRSPTTSSIAQPPLLATVAMQLYQQSENPRATQEALTRLLPQLIQSHRYLYRHRDPEGTGLVASFHPWESGMDNSPAWHEALKRVPEIDWNYQRRDLQLVASEQRPSKKDYDRFLYLVDLFASLNFDDEAIYERCPFKVQDVGFNSVLLRANSDLLSLCEALNFPADVADLRETSERSLNSMRQLWSEEHSCFFSRDLVSNELIPVRTTGTLLPLYARAASPAQAKKMEQALEYWLNRGPYGIASTHPDEPSYQRMNYWRGPSWLHINWMISLGLDEYGFEGLAGKLKDVSSEMLRTSGFCEYYDSQTGKGCGGRDFSWTAATGLFWCLQG
ncbi:MAG: trehalase family glycosidase [Pseudomonadota bacterium]